jgi:3-deoxy-manno-octulosonate cytidylyltransferase (CMP-KDO synthetase)
MKAAIVIPARRASTRLPDKLLLPAGGKPLIQHAWERARAVSNAVRVIIAVDDPELQSVATGFGAEVRMTSPAHTSGTSRIAEAVRSEDFDVIVNVQGDEPELDPVAVERLIALQAATRPFASTIAAPFPAAAQLDDPACVKAVLGRRIAAPPAAGDCREAIYFTRALAPFPRDGAADRRDYFLHVGVYAFRPDSLAAFAQAAEGRLERIERLEQLRILELGERIYAAIAAAAAPGIDTPADLAAFRARLAAAG